MQYYAMIDGERRGPYELSALAEAGVRPSTYVWCKGMDDWEKAEDVADICRMFHNRIHDLMHPSSVDAERRPGIAAGQEQTEQTDVRFPTRYDRYLNDSPPLPSVDEIEERRDTEIRPVNMLPLSIVATVLFFPPTGIVAIVNAVRSAKAWKAGDHKEAHALCQAAKMWTGISFFLGLILYAFLSRFA